MASRLRSQWRSLFLFRRFFPKHFLLRHFLLISALACAFVLTFSGATLAQLPSFGELPSSTLRPSSVHRYGSLEVTWVTSPLSGKALFKIAAPTVFDRSDLSKMQLAVEVRARNIEQLMSVEIKQYREQEIIRLFNSDSSPEAPPPAQVITSTLRNLPVIQVVVEDHYRPLTIATITSADVDLYGQPPEKIAEQWRASLQSEVDIIQALFSPSSLRQRMEETASILLGLVVLTIVLSVVRWQFYKRQKKLKDTLAAEATKAAVEKAEMRQTQTSLTAIDEAELEQPHLEQPTLKTTAAQQTDQKDTDTHQSNAAASVMLESAQADLFVENRLNRERWLDIYKFVRWILLWVVILSWYAGTYLATTRLPSLMRWSEKVLVQPLRLIVIWFLVSLAIRISSFLIQRSLSSWTKVSYLTFGDAQRKVVRSHTISAALQDLAIVVFLLLGILLTLVDFGLPPTSIVAGSAIIGFVFSFGTQSLVKDLVNGCLILVEDQFAVGDIIAVNGESGVVERLDLRLTQIRNLDGELISIPNSTITLVKNKSNSWARVNLGIEVAYSTNLDDAITVIKNTTTQMSQDAKWQSLILEPPEILGVDSFNESSITIRLLMRTAPAQQWLVARELRRRLKQALDQANISIPFPQRSIWVRNTPSAANTATDN